MKSFFYGIMIFSLLFVGILPNVLAEDSNCEGYSIDGYQYQFVEPLDHSITSGEFLSFCAEPDYLWYKIYLNTLEPGSLAITIPKDAIDLKQFDYESCYFNSLSTNLPYFKDVTVKQISQTDQSRTLEFTWLKPITHIEYFGTYAIIDGINYSEPLWCIGLVESGQKSAEIKVMTLDDLYSDCPQRLDYNHQITNGKIEKTCFEVNTNAIIISLKDIISNTILTIDIPYTDMPLMTTENYQGFILLVNDIGHPAALKLTNQYLKYQTFDIDLVSNSNYVELIYAYAYSLDYDSNGMNHNYNLTIPLLDLEKTPCKSNFVSIMKHDNSKSVCVKQITAEKLIQRGYGFLDN